MKTILSELIYPTTPLDKELMLFPREAADGFREWPAQRTPFFLGTMTALGKLWSTSNRLKLLKWAPWSISLCSPILSPYYS